LLARIFSSALLLLALSLPACRPSLATPPTPSPASIVATATPAPTLEPALTPGALPAVVTDLEAGVDVLFVRIPAGEWEHASSTVEGMIDAWYVHGLEISLAGASQATLNSLDAALADLAGKTAAQDAAGALQAANLVSAYVADLYDLFLPTPSADLRRLTMIERQLWLDAAAGDPHVIQGDFAQLQAIWQRVVEPIRRDGGDAFADQFEASLAAQAQYIQANDAAGLLAETSRGMEMVRLLR